jgi:hypothetical protein
MGLLNVAGVDLSVISNNRVTSTVWYQVPGTFYSRRKQGVQYSAQKQCRESITAKDGERVYELFLFEYTCQNCVQFG